MGEWFNPARLRRAVSKDTVSSNLANCVNLLKRFVKKMFAHHSLIVERSAVDTIISAMQKPKNASANLDDGTRGYSIMVSTNGSRLLSLRSIRSIPIIP